MIAFVQDFFKRLFKITPMSTETNIFLRNMDIGNMATSLNCGSGRNVVECSVLNVNSGCCSTYACVKVQNPEL